jgi:hypothetical protein
MIVLLSSYIISSIVSITKEQGEKKMKDEDVHRLIISIRNNWGSKDYDFDRCIRSLGLALIRCSEKVLPTVEAMINEAETRQLYQLLRGNGDE